MRADSPQLLSLVSQAATELVRQLETARTLPRDDANAQAAERLVHSAMAHCLEQLARTACWGPSNQLPSSLLWRIGEPELKHGSLQLHARTKPRGYAGDFHLLDRICRNDVRGPSPLGFALDRFFQQQSAPQAVRNRSRLVADWIVAQFRRRGIIRPFRLVSFGSGPAWDLKCALEQLADHELRHIQLALVDLDPQALDYSRAVVGNFLPLEQCSFVRENLYRTATNATTRRTLRDASMIVCTGLFDYLPDQAAVATLSAFWHGMEPGGRLIVFNFSSENPSRAYMEWIGNWYLRYRSAEQFGHLAQLAGIPPSSVRDGAEPTGTDLFLDIQR